MFADEMAGLDEDDASSSLSDSDSPLTAALELCVHGEQSTVARAGGDDHGAGACLDAPPPATKLHWRKRKQIRQDRKSAASKATLRQISQRLGRHFKTRLGAARPAAADASAQGHTPYTPKLGSYTTELLQELTFGRPDDAKLVGTFPSMKEQAASCGASKESAGRARSLTLDALSDKAEDTITEKKVSLSKRAINKDRESSGHKFSWDESALRFYCPLEVVKSVCPGLEFTPRKLESKKKRRTDHVVGATSSSPGPGAAGVDTAASGVVGAPAPSDATGVTGPSSSPQPGEVVVRDKPVYVVQVMQCGGAMKLGDELDAEYVIRPTLVESTSAEHLWEGIEPWTRTDMLEASSQPGDAPFLGLYGDSLKANKLLVTKAGEDTKEAGIPLHDGLCFGHQLSIGIDEQLKGAGDGVDLINPLYCTKKLMQQAKPRQDLNRAFDHFAKKANVYRGVVPPLEYGEHAKRVLHNTLGDGVNESLYALRNGNGTHTEYGAKEAAIVDEAMKVHNGDWKSDVWTHFCVRGRDDRRPCCKTIKESRERLASSMKSVNSIVVWDKLKEGTKKWGENGRRCTKLSFLTNLSRSFKLSFLTNLYL